MGLTPLTLAMPKSETTIGVSQETHELVKSQKREGDRSIPCSGRWWRPTTPTTWRSDAKQSLEIAGRWG
jgi:hypothetical protein